jgi:hypothetical protein
MADLAGPITMSLAAAAWPALAVPPTKDYK